LRFDLVAGGDLHVAHDQGKPDEVNALKAAFLKFKLHNKEMVSTDRIKWGQVISPNGPNNSDGALRGDIKVVEGRPLGEQRLIAVLASTDRPRSPL
jgi:hypothetical protein